MFRKFLAGYNWRPWTPYSAPKILRVWRGIHNALHMHHRSRDGAWCYGYDYICGGCGMNVGKWSEKKIKITTDAINKLPPEKQQSAAANTAGGRTYDA